MLVGGKSMLEKHDDKESIYLSIVENSPDYIIQYDRDFRHLYINEAGLRVTAVKREKIVGKTHHESGLYDQFECEYWEEQIGYVFKTGSPYQEQFELESPDNLMWLDWSLTSQYDESGNIVSVLAVSHDITKLIQAEKEYRETQEIFHHFMLNSPIYVFIKDTEIRSIRLSKNFEQMLGREIKMIELKKEINELLKKSGKKAKYRIPV